MAFGYVFWEIFLHVFFEILQLMYGEILHSMPIMNLIICNMTCGNAISFAVTTQRTRDVMDFPLGVSHLINIFPGPGMVCNATVLRYISERPIYELCTEMSWRLVTGKKCSRWIWKWTRRALLRQ